MMFKFFRTGKKGGATEYARRSKDWRDKPRPHGAIELYGRGELIAAVVTASPWVQKYVAGVFAFSEQVAAIFPTAWQKCQAMILQYLCGGHSPDDFSIAFVCHVGTDLRPHVHFEFGTRHLPSGRSIPPFRKNHDGPAIRNLCRLLNLLLGLRDPDTHPQLMQPAPHRASRPVRQMYNDIARIMRHKFEKGEIHCRADAIAVLRWLGVRILREGRSCVVVKPNTRYAAFALRGRLYWEEFTRSGFEAELRAAELESQRPLAHRICEFQRRHEQYLNARHTRITECLGECRPESSPMTKGQRIARNRTVDARSRALEVSAHKRPLPLERYQFAIPAAAIEQLRAVGVRFPDADLQLRPMVNNPAGVRARTTADPDGLPFLRPPIKCENSDDARRTKNTTEHYSSEDSHTQPDRCYDYLNTCLAAARKRLAEIRVRDLALRRLREAARRVGAVARSCAALARRSAALADRSAEFGRTTADTVTQLDRDSRARVRRSAERIAAEAHAQRIQRNDEPAPDAQTPIRRVAECIQPPRGKPLPLKAPPRAAPTPSSVNRDPTL